MEEDQFWNLYYTLNGTQSQKRMLSWVDNTLSSLPEESFLAFLNSLPEDEFWDWYGKLNGTQAQQKMDNMLLDADGSDASEEVWGDVWDETSRKKRSINLDNMMKDTGDYRMVASMGLQALLTFDPEELDIPKNFHGIPKCLAEILWETEGSTKLCSLIPKSLKNKLRQILMTILRQELSTKFFDVEFYSKFFEQVVKDEETMDDWSKIVQIVQSKYMVPVTSEDLLEIWTIAKTIWTRNVKKVSDSSKKSVLNLVTDLFNAMKEDNVFSKLVVIVRKVQG